MNSLNEENILKQAGLSEEQAVTYEALLEKGPQKASMLANWTGIKRGLTYKVLEQLENMGLVEKKGGTGTVAVFYPAHPSILLDKMDRDKKNLELAKEVVNLGLGNLTSKYNLLSGKPNIRFFEGEDGIKEVLYDTLTLSKEDEIYTYVDLEAILKYIPEINEEYSKKREKLGIKKKGLMLDTIHSREVIKNYLTDITETKFIKFNVNEFETVIQIYNNKISYITLKEGSMIGVILEDPYIYKMHKSIFEHLWEITPSAQQNSQ